MLRNVYWIFTFLRLRTFFTCSHSASTEILYLLWSQHLVFHIDEPWRSRASAQLKLVFRFRKLMIPLTQATLRLFQLSHGFLQRCRRFFREFLQLNSPNFFHHYKFPLHPSSRSRPTHWSTTSSPSAAFYASGLLKPLRNAFVTGSDLTLLDILTPDTSSASFLLPEANLTDTVWPEERYFLNHSVTQMERWLPAWNLPTRLQVEWQHFFRQEWERHQHHHSAHPTGWSRSEISPLRQRLCGWSRRPLPTYSRTHLSLPLPPPPAQDLHSFTYHFHTCFPTTTTWDSLDQNSTSRPLATPSPATILLGPSLGSPTTFRLHPTKTLSRLEQGTPDRVLHSNSQRPTQSDGGFRHLLSPRSLTFFHFFVAFGDYCRVLTPRMTSSSINRTSPASSISSHILA